MCKTIYIKILILIVVITVIGNTKYALAEEGIREKRTETWAWPVEGVITDHFGTRGGQHYGIDIAAEKGTEIQSVGEGEVHRSYYSTSYGHVIFIKHPNEVETVYAHLSKRLVSEGDKITKGQIIGLVGNSGRSDGNHLHFEVHKSEWNVSKSNAIDPMVFLQKDTGNHPALEVSKDERTHVETIMVEAGDTLWELSQTYDVTIEQLRMWNELSSHLIVTGSHLIVFKDPS